MQQVIAIFVEGHQPQAAEIHSTQFTLDPLAHLSGGIVGIGYSEYFPRQRAALVNQTCYAAGKNRGLSGSGARHHQHRTLPMFDCPPLLLVRLKDARRKNGLRDCHFARA